MISLASLLNPAPPEPPVSGFHPNLPSSLPAASSTDEAPLDRQLLAKQKKAKESGGFTKSKLKGTINFPPYENLDESSLIQVRKFQVYPLGKIQEYCRHIPYNSGKKDFYEKTGRESFEGKTNTTISTSYPKLICCITVFQYIFKVPEDDSDYTVMWDYNVGLVRMTPFFKCCKYSKVSTIYWNSAARFHDG
jgi:hypothetical protein